MSPHKNDNDAAENADFKAFAGQVKAAFVSPPPASVETQHLAAIMAAVTDMAPGVMPEAPQTAPSRRQATRLRPIRAWQTLAGSLAAKVAFGAVAAVAATGGLAAANLLPPRVQNPVAHVGDAITPFTFPTAPSAGLPKPKGPEAHNRRGPAVSNEAGARANPPVAPARTDEKSEQNEVKHPEGDSNRGRGPGPGERKPGQDDGNRVNPPGDGPQTGSNPGSGDATIPPRGDTPSGGGREPGSGETSTSGGDRSGPNSGPGSSGGSDSSGKG